jgi:hypothetical protein
VRGLPAGLLLALAACSRAPTGPSSTQQQAPAITSGTELIAALAPRGDELVLANFWATW